VFGFFVCREVNGESFLVADFSLRCGLSDERWSRYLPFALVTLLLVPVGVPLDAPGVDPLKYQRESQQTRAAGSGELLTVKVRFKEPDGETSRLLSRVLSNQSTAMTANLGFASAVAEFGMLLRESPLRGSASFASLTARARKFVGEDEDGYRAQFIQLADRAAMLRAREPASQSRR
jgi:hypothetical protein